MKIREASGEFRISKLKTGVFLAAGLIVVGGGAGLALRKIASEVGDAKAAEGEIEIIDFSENSSIISKEFADENLVIGGMTKWGDLDNSGLQYGMYSAGLGDGVFETADTLPIKYNSHDTYNTYTRTKNQNSEGLCWAYAESTVMEYALEKNYTAMPVSAKHMDYQFVDAVSAYKPSDIENGVTNAQYDKWVDMGGSRKFGDGGNIFSVLLGLTNPVSIMPETDFTAAIKANDNRLSAIEKYEDIWDLDNLNDILTIRTDGSGIKTYTVKQDYAAMNDLEKAGYMVTGVNIIEEPTYGASNDKTVAVNAIKQAIKDYGAVEVMTFFDMPEEEQNHLGCMSYKIASDLSTVYATIIDRSGSANACNDKTGHAMSIIGWDDTWTYMDNGVEKQGAFIVQNSYGPKWVYIYTLDDGSKIHPDASYYMSYDSALEVLYFSDFDAVDEYDHVYSLGDYQAATIDSANNEFVFEFKADSPQNLAALTFNENVFLGLDYDVYVSTTGNAANFKKVGAFESHIGMTKYVFTSTVKVNGKYAVKLVRTARGLPTLSNGWDVVDRKLNVLNVMTKEASADEPEDPEEPEEPEENTVTWVQGQNYTKGAGQDLIVRFSYDLDKFQSVTMDGTAIAADNYSVARGSTILTIKHEYLDSLAAGSHRLVANFAGNVSTPATFTIAAENVPVPDTSGGEDTNNGSNNGSNAGANEGSRAGSPDTGANTAADETGAGAGTVVAYVMVVMVAGTFVALKVRRARIIRRKFGW